MIRFRRLLQTVFHRQTFEQDPAEEIRLHLEHRIDDLVGRGLSLGDAQRQARIEFGGIANYRERETSGLINVVPFTGEGGS